MKDIIITLLFIVIFAFILFPTTKAVVEIMRDWRIVRSIVKHGRKLRLEGVSTVLPQADGYVLNEEPFEELVGSGEEMRVVNEKRPGDLFFKTTPVFYAIPRGLKL